MRTDGPHSRITAAMLMILITQGIYAKPSKGMGPPPEAIEACVGKTEGEVVSFQTPRGHTLEATCRTMKAQLIAVPDHHRQDKRREGGKALERGDHEAN